MGSGRLCEISELPDFEVSVFEVSVLPVSGLALTSGSLADTQPKSKELMPTVEAQANRALERYVFMVSLAMGEEYMN
ncbi:MAG: hypothetical protein BroJett014_01470 [Planctomycetota bacterium]|nr:MAG: hypothetical protein BroJett014_01470 [Planctomycetota bacterium]